ncbi:hypothetical protein B0H10DRAFT_729329 [Mycena sp. CBHHK59/15]|nr:hypothetical protein B0H10DRAFT_729329 [Mycena sp. CBHHK59/15]
MLVEIADRQNQSTRCSCTTASGRRAPAFIPRSLDLHDDAGRQPVSGPRHTRKMRAMVGIGVWERGVTDGERITEKWMGADYLPMWVSDPRQALSCIEVLEQI